MELLSIYLGSILLLNFIINPNLIYLSHQLNNLIDLFSKTDLYDRSDSRYCQIRSMSTWVS